MRVLTSGPDLPPALAGALGVDVIQASEDRPTRYALRLNPEAKRKNPAASSDMGVSDIP